MSLARNIYLGFVPFSVKTHLEFDKATFMPLNEVCEMAVARRTDRHHAEGTISWTEPSDATLVEHYDSWLH